ncbi:MAG TPA: GntR family transcriptional regulator [Thermoanaerobaculia bacterium]
MARALHVDPASSTPIWSQIEEGVRRLVASGALPLGGPVPSVRDLARELRVNPATVAKAYQRLADAGILTVRRGEGTFVSETAPAMGRTERSRTLRDGATRYASLASTIGATQEEASGELRTAWRLFGHGVTGGKR